MGTRLKRSGRRGVLHYVTINVRNRVKAFRQDLFTRATAEVLRRHCDEHPARLIAYVIMPEHVHFINNPRNGDINRFLSQLKPAVTLRVKELAEELGNQRVLDWLRMPNGEYHLWQYSKHNLHLYSDRLIWQKINYIHTNPIVRGLVETAADYPYSSFRSRYQLDSEIIVPVDREFWWEEEEDYVLEEY